MSVGADLDTSDGANAAASVSIGGTSVSGDVNVGSGGSGGTGASIGVSTGSTGGGSGGGGTGGGGTGGGGTGGNGGGGFAGGGNGGNGAGFTGQSRTAAASTGGGQPAFGLIGASVWSSDGALVGMIDAIQSGPGGRVDATVRLSGPFAARHNSIVMRIAPTEASNGRLRIGMTAAQFSQQLNT